jgi:polyribonucleotide nucleotidyltransferase
MGNLHCSKRVLNCNNSIEQDENACLVQVMQKWKSETVFRDQIDAGDMDADQTQLRMVMLGKLCGAVIGEGGKTIKEIMMATNTDIRVQVGFTWEPADHLGHAERWACC